MKYIILRRAILTLLFIGVMPAFALAQSAAADDTATAVAAGEQMWQKLQAKQVSCGGLSDANFENLGEYFMSQMMGNSHEEMNHAVASRMGKSGEEQMHTIMDKRLSGCDHTAAYPAGFQDFMPMMGLPAATTAQGDGTGMMTRNGSNYYRSNNTHSMMGGYGFGSSMMGFPILGSLAWLVVLADLILVGIWLSQQISKR